MLPPDEPLLIRPPRTTCTDCDATLEAHEIARCWRCVEAAHAAIRANPGVAITPSLIAQYRAPF